MNKENILLSAYAAEPNRGSEPGLGWLWAMEYVELGHKVVLLTCGYRHRDKIEAYRSEVGLPTNLEIRYVDVPWPRLKNGFFLQHIHYILWQIRVGLLTRHMRRLGERFAISHHVTWASLRYPSFLAKNGRLVFGPVGGAERPNWKIVAKFSLKEILLEVLRVVSAGLSVRVPFLNGWLRRMDVVAVCNKDNKWVFPRDMQNKLIVTPSIGLHDFPMGNAKRLSDGKYLKLLFVGRFLSWKGLGTVLKVVNDLKNRDVAVSLTVIGEGDKRDSYIDQAKMLGIADVVDWKGWGSRADLVAYYDNADIFLFPSLHDSGGLVVLEALSRGTPVVALDLGGPSVFIDEKCGQLISGGLSESETIVEIAQAVIALSDSVRYESASKFSVQRANYYRSYRTVARFIESLEN